MPILTCEISQSLLKALEDRVRTSGEPLNHIVMRALADELQVSHATLFQVSTSSAIVESIDKGVVTVGQLKNHGDFGIGTFADLDGEMVAADGRFWRILKSGIVCEALDSDLVPFAIVTDFKPERNVELRKVTSFDDLSLKLDALRNSNNLFFAVRVEGQFSHVHTRAVGKTVGGTGLLEAASTQAEFDFDETAGTIVGFWTPQYVKSINIVGWHLHFLNANSSGGGHLLNVVGNSMKVQIQHIDDYHIAIPESPNFSKRI